MKNFEKNVLEKLDKIISLLESTKVSVEPKELEDHNFKINSDGWKKITVDGESYLVNDKEDIWELLNRECAGEQLFTWDAAMRETKKLGKTIPTDEQLSGLLKDKSDFKNITFPGFRLTNGFYDYLGSYLALWSSSESSSTTAWRRFLATSYSTVYRYASSKGDGFSVRCLKD
jgi:uncharacterized protein (TIGR02145 family)